MTVLSSAWRSGLVLPEALPLVATEFLVSGLDSPALRDLAGLDLAPFTAGEAADLVEKVFDEMGVAQPAEVQRLEIASALLLHEYQVGTRTARQTTRAFYHLAWRESYPSEPPELMDLYQLDDAWHLEAEGVVVAAVSGDARRLLERLGLSHWQPPEALRAALMLTS